MDRRDFLSLTPALVLGGCVSVGGAAGPPAPAPALRVGDRWVYNCSDGFRVPVTWVETHQVVSIDASAIAVRVTLAGPTMNYDRVERWQAPGIVVVGSIYDDAFNRDFRAPLIRYQFPLTPGASWRQNVQYPDPDNQLVSNVQRYVSVGGYETVSTPAGTFNAITMRTIMSVDNNSPFNWPTQCDYLPWWAPDVGAKVRETKYATYRERGDEQAIAIRAQNTLIELASYSRGVG
jgi:hypothetical protein